MNARSISAAALWAVTAWAQIQGDEARERFLRTAEVVSTHVIEQGVTRSLRAELTDGTFRHGAQIQIVSKRMPEFISGDGEKHAPMWDHWRFNVAAYRIDRLLGLGMTPPCVARRWNNSDAAFMWWADDIAMQEVDRLRNNIAPPDTEAFSRQMANARVFDELIFNIDRNNSNLLVTREWNVVLIDHTRAFTAYPEIRKRENLARCGRKLLEAMRSLTEESLTKTVEEHLTAAEIKALIVRRDRILAHFKARAAKMGEDRVLFP